MSLWKERARVPLLHLIFHHCSGQTRGAEYRKKPKVKHESRASLGSTSSSKKSKKNAEQSFDFPAMGAEYGGLGAGSSSTEMNAFMPCDEVAAMQQQQQQQPTETPV